jgi:hypothetical protein
MPFGCMEDPPRCTPADCDTASPADPEACLDPAGNFDRLIYDVDSVATCDPATFRCVDQPSTPSAAAGDPCSDDAECEPGGHCNPETPDGRWVGGSCSKIRCDLPGNECANGGVCKEGGTEVPSCHAGCTVGGYQTSDSPETLVAEGSARSTCREGYGCVWDGTATAGEVNGGACLPITYHPTVTEPNIGAPCDDDADCYSPLGAGVCMTGHGLADGYCSIRNCAAPWLEDASTPTDGLCAPDAICVAFAVDDPTRAFCLRECVTADECAPGLGCLEISVDGARACFAGCVADADCRSGERCQDVGTPNAECVAE